MIPLKEYAQKYGWNLRVLQRKAKEGRINAVRIGWGWYIDEENANVIDERMTTGEYVNWRKKGEHVSADTTH